MVFRFPETDADGADEYIYDLHPTVTDYYPFTVTDYVEVKLPKSYRERKMPNKDTPRREVILAEIERLQKELHRYKGFPDRDPFVNGAVIKYTRIFQQGKTYQYAALRAGDLWYTTETGPTAGKSWAQLVDILISSTTHDIQVSGDWNDLGDVIQTLED